MTTRTAGDATAAAPLDDSGVEASGLGGALTHAKTALALLALLTYAVLRVVYGRFYGAFGLSPDDLGLGYAELLAQAALAMAALLVLQAVVVTLVAVLWIGMLVELIPDARRLWARLRGRDVPAREEDDTPEWVGLTIFGAFVLLVALSVVTGDSAIAGNGLLAIVIGGLAVSYVGLVARGIAQARRGVSGELTLHGRPMTAWWRGGVAAIVVAITAAATATLVLAADDDVDAVREGRSAHFTRLGVRLVSWGAEPATIAWTSADAGGELRSLANECLMYLGQHDGTLLLYSPHAQQPATHRVPASLATVSIAPGRRCRRGDNRPVP
jgi:hypothetical protein